MGLEASRRMLVFITGLVTCLMRVVHAGWPFYCHPGLNGAYSRSCFVTHS